WLGLIGRPILASSIDPVVCEGSGRRAGRGLGPRRSASGVSAEPVPGSCAVARAFGLLRTTTLRSGSRGQAGLRTAAPAACGGGRIRGRGGNHRGGPRGNA